MSGHYSVKYRTAHNGHILREKKNTFWMNVFPLARTWNDQKCRALLARSCSRRVSHVFSFEKKAASFEGTGYSTLLKWIVMYAWQTLIMRLVSACFKEETLEMREELIRSHIFIWLDSFSTWLPRKLCFPLFSNELSYGSLILFMPSGSAANGTSFKRTPSWQGFAAAPNKVVVDAVARTFWWIHDS